MNPPKKEMHDSYIQIRCSLLKDPNTIIAIEKKYMELLFSEIEKGALKIQKDFNTAMKLTPFWLRYAPRQRGHKPRGDALPWGEVGEKVLEPHLLCIIVNTFKDISFPGLPFGHDIRFKTDDVFIHMDVKSTGPTDNVDEVVCSPNQVSGDGVRCDEEGILNSKVTVTGPSRTMEFQPELPPFYFLEGQTVLTLTYYLKCVYSVKELGDQPLSYLEFVCVPNGLIMFDGPRYAFTVSGLLTPGKDIKDSKHKRTRIKLNPLAKACPWRCKKIIFTGTGYTTGLRTSSPLFQ